MYIILLLVLLHGSALIAADDAGIVVPKTLDGVPAYCVQFLKQIVTQPLESDLLSVVDDWEDNMALNGWDDHEVTHVLLEAAHSVSDVHTPIELLAMSEQELSSLYDTAIKGLHAGWKKAPLEQFPIPFKRPDELCLFVNEQKHVSKCDGFIRFLIGRLGMQNEANCRSFCNNNRRSLVWNKKSYLWIKKGSLQAFLKVFNFDLGQ